MSENWFQELFINEAKPALKRHSGGGGSGREPVLNEKEITENGVYTPPEGVDGFSKVEVDVPIPDGYIVPEGSMMISENGTYDVTNYAGATVEVASSGSGDTLKTLLDATKSTYHLFYFSTLTSLEGLIPYNATSNVTDMKRMFDYCKQLTTVPLFDTSKVTDMSYMFYNCTDKLTTVPLFDTSSVTDMKYMFSDCEQLTTVPQFNTSSVTNMAGMLQNCEKLITVPQFNTSSVTNMESMFYGCKQLTTVPLFDTSSVTNMTSMFQSCEKLITVPQFNTSSVTNMPRMFYSCKQLTTVPLFDTSSVTDMKYMFYSCNQLTTVPLFDTSSVTNINYMFGNCSALTTVPQFDVSRATDIASMFNNCKSLTTCLLRNISAYLQVGSGTSYGHLLTMDSLLNLLNETRYYTSGTKTLTVGTANLAKFTGEYEYVKLTGEIVDVDDNPCELVDGCKVRCTWCSANDEGAMTVAAYMQSKGWNIA